ncbi:hypothetical protein MLD38_029901 [Melastoma candidum]|uniref:Uncharacterized protein n=1 Tax=Melastoma candidum TaxID=119954 RepID=A0ACB9MLK7_9MYRT|nr:hypothetical protein MLD38_029901 [Melastoma candidum]
MKPIRDRLDDLHIYNDHSDDSGMSDEEVTNESEGSEEDDWEEQEVIVHTKLSSDELNACTTSSPAPADMVSAIKGSREKQGNAPREFRVTWAPDVYEPAPMRLQDAVVRGSKQLKLPKKERMTGKEGQKGKEISRGGSSKDPTRGGGGGGKDKKKKQNHRANGRSSKSFGGTGPE